jgi:hypothetical protein
MSAVQYLMTGVMSVTVGEAAVIALLAYIVVKLSRRG